MSEDAAISQAQIDAFVDHAEGQVSRRIFVDPEVYKLEQERLFGRTWLYLAHESQLSESSNVVSARMGEVAVAVTRADDGEISALVNVCPACDLAVCRPDEGRLEELTCPQHGVWDLKGTLLAGALPVNLMRVPQVQSYRGLIFGNLDADAPSLETFLGDIRWGLDLLMEQGELEVSGVMKWQADCNWKFAAESSVNEIYHGTAHLSMYDENSPEMDFDREGFTILTEYGHGLNAEALREDLAGSPLNSWRSDPLVQRRLGSFRMNVGRACITIFPNVTLSSATRQMKIWHPSGPTKTDIWLVTFRHPGDSEEVRRAYARAQSMVGPAGLLSQDETEMWEKATANCLGTTVRNATMNYQMGLGKGVIIEDELSPPRIETLINEHRELWFYRNWQTALKASGWQEWQEQRPVPTGVV